MKKTVYLDYNATCPTAPEVLEAMLPYLREKYENPSSVYRLAQDDARGQHVARRWTGARDSSSCGERDTDGGQLPLERYCFSSQR